jgi:hypothetical protein
MFKLKQLFAVVLFVSGLVSTACGVDDPEVRIETLSAGEVKPATPEQPGFDPTSSAFHRPDDRLDAEDEAVCAPLDRAECAELKAEIRDAQSKPGR